MRAYFVLSCFAFASCESAISSNVDILHTETSTYLTAVGDFNEDGMDDVISIGSYPAEVSDSYLMHFYYSQGDEGPLWALPAQGFYGRPTTIAPGDMNQDGMLDLVLGFEDGTIELQLSDENSSLYREDSMSRTEAEPFSLSLADLNQDSYPDVITSTWGFVVDHMEFSPYVSLFFNTGEGSFAPEQRIYIDREIQDAETGDFDRDGDNDIVLLSWKPGDDFYARQFRLFVFVNDGVGGFSLQQEIIGEGSFVWPDHMSDLLNVVDITGDGALDLAVITDKGAIALFENSGQASFRQTMQRLVVNILQTGGEVKTLLSGDFDADGRQDLAFTVSGQEKRNERGNWDYNNCYVVLLRNDGAGDFEVLRVAEMDGFLGGAAVGYLDGDERLDVAVAKTSDGERRPGMYIVHLPGEEER